MRAQRRVVGRLDERVEQEPVVAGVIALPGCGRERKLAGGNRVAPAQLDRIHGERAGGLVREPLDHERPLGAAGAPVGADRRCGREDAGQVDVDRVEHVGPGQAARVVARVHGRAERQLAADRADDPRGEPAHLALRVHSQLGVAVAAAAVVYFWPTP